uniref:K transporter protein n=1 Tax=Fragaria vesca subsp. vesca TaxID=101020 RepID=A0A5J5ZXQ8_FRAVE|nr:K transporter protein [Fragaria vesca subsp. vesca]
MNPSEELVEQGISPRNLQRVSCTAAVLTLAYQSLGVVYGDLSISPLYVYKTTFSGKLSLHEDGEEIFGVLSFIIWTFTLIALCKYVFIVMLADDNGEGGTFALYSLLCRHARLSILPNQEITDEKLSEYVTEGNTDTSHSAALKSFFNKHPRFRKGLLIFVLFGTCMAIGDGVLTPSISVLSAVSGVKIKFKELHDSESSFHHGTHRVAFMFAPIITAWLLCISGIGIYNIVHWNQRVFLALSPVYMLKFLRTTRIDGWVSLAGVVLSITGVEAMFANLGHFSSLSIKLAFTCLVYPSLVLSYMGEAAFLSKHHEDIQRSFYRSIPGKKLSQKPGSYFSHLFHHKPVFCSEVLSTGQDSSYFKVGSDQCNVCDNLLDGSASVTKIPEGGWIPVLMSLVFMAVMYTWNYGTMMKHQFDVENKVSINRIVCLGPSLGMVRVPGIGVVYTNLVTGVPAVFGHFVTNLPAFHKVLIFVCVKCVQVPHVSENERLIISRVGPKECGMFRCIVRYGYKDLQENCNFENRLVSGIVQFVETEDCSDAEAFCSPDQTSVKSKNEENMTQISCNLQDESLQILEAKESGVTYILGHTHAKAKKSASFFKKVAIDIVYNFLSKNCREPDVVLNVPPTSLLEVGMVYYV